MIYRTVEVTATLSPLSISVTPVLDDHPQLSEYVEGNIVEVTADIVGSIVTVTPSLSGDVTVTAELTTAVHYSGSDIYDGTYEVTPLAHDAVVLPTRHKQMRDNVTVFKVPYYETTNVSGTTVYIAEG